jgi:transposase
MAAAALFEKGKKQADVVRACDVTRQTASRWYAVWEKQGRAGLRAAGRAGRKPRLNARQVAAVEAALLRGPTAHGYATELWTLPRIAQVILRVCGVRYHPGHVWPAGAGCTSNGSRRTPPNSIRSNISGAT